MRESGRLWDCQHSAHCCLRTIPDQLHIPKPNAKGRQLTALERTAVARSRFGLAGGVGDRKASKSKSDEGEMHV